MKPFQNKVKTNVLQPKRTQTIIDDAVGHEAAMGGEDISIYASNLTKDGYKISRSSTLKSVPPLDMSYSTYLSQCVEHAASVTILDHTPPNSGHPQPSLHIGILPIQSNAPDKEAQETIITVLAFKVVFSLLQVESIKNGFTWILLNFLKILSKN